MFSRGGCHLEKFRNSHTIENSFYVFEHVFKLLLKFLPRPQFKESTSIMIIFCLAIILFCNILHFYQHFRFHCSKRFPIQSKLGDHGSSQMRLYPIFFMIYLFLQLLFVIYLVIYLLVEHSSSDSETNDDEKNNILQNVSIFVDYILLFPFSSFIIDDINHYSTDDHLIYNGFFLTDNYDKFFGGSDSAQSIITRNLSSMSNILKFQSISNFMIFFNFLCITFLYLFESFLHFFRFFMLYYLQRNMNSDNSLTIIYQFFIYSFIFLIIIFIYLLFYPLFYMALFLICIHLISNLIWTQLQISLIRTAAKNSFSGMCFCCTFIHTYILIFC